MFKKSILISSIVTAILFTGCSKTEEVEQSNTAPKTFVPTENGQLTEIQVKSWISSNTKLDSLVVAFTPLLSDTTDSLYSTNRDLFQSTQNSVCKESGLVGGKEEYLWIAKNISKPINLPLMESLGLK